MQSPEKPKAQDLSPQQVKNVGGGFDEPPPEPETPWSTLRRVLEDWFNPDP